MRIDVTGPSPSLRIRPGPTTWFKVGLPLLAALPLVGLGIVEFAGDRPVAAAVYVLLAVGLILPAAYFAGAEVTVRDGVVAKVALFRKAGSCSIESIASVRPYARPLWYDIATLRTFYRRGYAFQRADGTTVFELNSNWWTQKDIARLVERVSASKRPRRSVG
jgi:hypothetical protein